VQADTTTLKHLFFCKCLLLISTYISLALHLVVEKIQYAIIDNQNQHILQILCHHLPPQQNFTAPTPIEAIQ